MNSKIFFFVFLASLFLVMPLGLGATNLISNGGFESISTNDVDYCCEALGSCSSVSTPTSVPDYWNDTEYGFHVGTSVDATSGYYSGRIFTHVPMNCSMWDGSCAMTNISIGGTATYEDVIEVQNSSVIVLADVKKCEYPSDEPLKCTGLFEEQVNFMGNADNSGLYFINTYWDNGTDENSVPYFGTAQDFWQTVSLNYGEYEFSNSSDFPQNITLSIGAGVESYWGNDASCVLFDDVRVEYTEGDDEAISYENVSTVDDFIEDMYTFWGTPSSYNIYAFGEDESCDGSSASPINDITFSTFDFSTSKKFSEIPFGQVSFKPSCSGCGSYNIIDYCIDCSSLATICKTNENGKKPYTVIVYNDGSTEDVSNEAFMYPEEIGSNPNRCPTGEYERPVMYIRFPMYDYKEIDYIHFNMTSIFGYESNRVFDECGWYAFNVTPDTVGGVIESRDGYDNPMEESIETITGYDNIFPLFVFNPSFDEGTGNISFTGWNFHRSTDNLDDNTEIWLTGSGGGLKNVKIEDFDFESASGVYTIRGGGQWGDGVNETTGFEVNVSDLPTFGTVFENPEDGDFVLVKMFSELGDNSTTQWNIGDEIGTDYCTDYCDSEDTFYDGYIDEYGLCKYTQYPNSTTCIDYEPEEDSEYAEEVAEALSGLRNATEEGGAYMQEIWSILDMSFDSMTKLLFGIIISIAFGVSTMIKLEGHQFSHVLGIIATLGGLGFFLFYGWLPMWIGIIMIFVSGYLLVRAVLVTFIS